MKEMPDYRVFMEKMRKHIKLTFNRCCFETRLNSSFSQQDFRYFTIYIAKLERTIMAGFNINEINRKLREVQRKAQQEMKREVDRANRVGNLRVRS